MEYIVFISFIFVPIIIIWLMLWAIEKQRYKRTRPMYNATLETSNGNIAQPSVTTTSNVIYTIPTNDPNRFSTNISTTTSLRHHYDLPPSYDQVVIQTVQTPTPVTPQTVIPVTPVTPTPCSSQLPVNPPSYTNDATPK